MNSPFADLLGRLGRLPYYLIHPQENPQIAVISLGIVAALALILVAMLILLYLRFSGRRARKGAPAIERRRAPRPEVSQPSKLAFAVKLTAALAVVLVLFSAGPYSVSQPKFCISCHSSKSAYDSWRSSTHSGLGCLACHKAPGAIGALELIAQGAGNASAAFFGTSGTSGSAKVRTAACLRCHDDVTTKTLVSSEIQVSHKEFLPAIPACTTCHQAAGHRKSVGNEVASSDAPRDSLREAGSSVMERCSACHNGQKAFADCRRCHVKDIGRQAHINPDDLPKISLSSPDLCTSCHAEEIARERKTAAKAAFPLVRRVCTACHSLDRLATSGIGERGWATLIRRMQLKGADFGPGESEQILNYLQMTYP